MGITLKDIAAQRAMLARGERKRLRDEFAAAALTGLLSNIPRYQLGVIAVQAYDIADEMLRERLRNGVVESRENEHYRGVEELGRPRRAHNPEIAGSNPAAPIHDAVPEAKAASSPLGNPVAAGLGTGNTPSKAEIDALEYVVEEGRTASIDDYGILRSWLIRLRPEWESQSYEESDEKRVNTTTNRDTTPTVGTDTAAHQTCPHVRGTVTQHCSLNFTLTAEEREAIETADAYMSAAGCRNTNAQDTLRGLLERLGESNVLRDR